MQNNTNLQEAAIRQAVLDYVESTYLVDPARARQSVRPDLAKLGFVSDGDRYAEYQTTFDELIETAKTFNQEGIIPPDASKKITIFEILDQIATVKLEAWWGIDYLHLIKQGDKWMIKNVVWQTFPSTVESK